MLLLLVQTGEELYAIDAGSVVEVLPLIPLRRLPGAPAGVAGVLNYHGAPVPVLDLAEFVTAAPSRHRMSTRIVVVHYGTGSGRFHALGIIVERALEMLSLEEKDFLASGVATPGAPHLGTVATISRGIVQRIDLQKILPPDVRKVLFAAMEDHGTGEN